MKVSVVSLIGLVAVKLNYPPYPPKHTPHAHAHARAHAHTHTHTRTHAHAHTHTHMLVDDSELEDHLLIGPAEQLYVTYRNEVWRCISAFHVLACIGTIHMHVRASSRTHTHTQFVLSCHLWHA